MKQSLEVEVDGSSLKLGFEVSSQRKLLDVDCSCQGLSSLFCFDVAFSLTDW